MVETGIDLINQGSYGCIFRPGINCKGKPIKNKKYITKVQKSATTSRKEAKIGKIIKTIANYDDYFAPILKTCEISMARMTDDKVKRCDFIEDDGKTYETNKLRYVGKNTLAKHILNVTEESPKRLFRVLLDTHKNILVGFNKLSSVGIVHFDVKENNIMIEDTTGNPIIIDFGLSSEIKTLNTNKYRDVFFVYGPDYSPWCIDICMLTYMANELENQVMPPGMLGFVGFEEQKTQTWLDGMVTKEKLTIVINDFITKNTAMVELVNAPQRTAYKTMLHEYFNKFIGKTWKELADTLEKNVSSWDCYAVSVMYSYIIRDLELNKVDVTVPSWTSYRKILEDTILASPDKRPSSNEMIVNIEKLFKNVSSNESKKLMRILDNILISKEKKTNIRTKMLTTIQNGLHRETKIYGAIK
jgi:serine/threonine protein kinase